MKYLEIKKEGFITSVNLNRPASMNALSTGVLKELTVFNDSLKDDFETRVVIYSGVGDNFSAGADLNEKSEPQTHLESWRKNFGKPAIESFLNIHQITIAAVNGYCLGGAACIASACDFRIADITILLGVPAAKIGIQYECKGISRVLSSLGSSCTKRIFLLAETIDYSSLSKTNFIDFWVEDSENVLVKAGDLANEISKNAPLAVNGMKKIIVELMQGSLDENAAAEEVKNCFDSQDHLEALLARREKRKPNFRGL